MLRPPAQVRKRLQQQLSPSPQQKTDRRKAHASRAVVTKKRRAKNFSSLCTEEATQGHAAVESHLSRPRKKHRTSDATYDGDAGRSGTPAVFSTQKREGKETRRESLDGAAAALQKHLEALGRRDIASSSSTSSSGEIRQMAAQQHQRLVLHTKKKETQQQQGHLSLKLERQQQRPQHQQEQQHMRPRQQQPDQKQPQQPYAQVPRRHFQQQRQQQACKTQQRRSEQHPHQPSTQQQQRVELRVLQRPQSETQQRKKKRHRSERKKSKPQQAAAEKQQHEQQEQKKQKFQQEHPGLGKLQQQPQSVQQSLGWGESGGKQGGGGGRAAALPATGSAAALAPPALQQQKKKHRRRAGEGGGRGAAVAGDRQQQQQQPGATVASTGLLKKKKHEQQPQQVEKAVLLGEARNSYRRKDLLQRLQQRLKGSRFRTLNEQLYTTTGQDALAVFQQNPSLFKVYHEGYRQQVEQWPLNPLTLIKEWVKTLPPKCVIGDFGCGEAALAGAFPHRKIYSYDLVAATPGVIACNLAHLPVDSEFFDVGIFCLSLMGTDWPAFLREAYRVLKSGGRLKIAEVASRFVDCEAFMEAVEALGFTRATPAVEHVASFFVVFEFRKESKQDGVRPRTATGLVEDHLNDGKRRRARKKQKSQQQQQLVSSLLKPCIYKRRG